MVLESDTTSLVKGEITDLDGSFSITNLPADTYFLRIQYVGLADYLSGPIPLSGGEARTLDPVQMGAAAHELAEVTVTARVPLIVRKLDRIVVNVENSLLGSSGTALDVLSRSPGVTVDQNGEVSLRGRPGVLVLIDGKNTQLRGSELAALLKATPADAVAKVEIMAHPSARYEAAGDAGIIDIITKKSQNLGFNGSANAGVGRGRFGKANAGLNFNYRNGFMNLFGGYNYSYRKIFNDLNLYRQYKDNGVPGPIYDQVNRITIPINSQLPRLGADFYLSERSTVGVLFNGNFSSVSGSGNNNLRLLDPENLELRQQLLTQNASSDQRNNYSGNVNFQHQFAAEGRSLSFDLDHIRYDRTTQQRFVTDVLDATGTVTENAEVRNDTDSGLEVYSAKADYTHPLANGANLSAGAKASYVTTDNRLNVFQLEEGEFAFDPLQSSHFRYSEHINAAYVNYDLQSGDLQWRFGLRAEQTIADGLQLTTDSAFQRRYLQLFPSAGLSWQASEAHAWSLSLSRRILRPSYGQLNPFRIYVDPNTYAEGNPYLLPQLTYAASLSHRWDRGLTTTLTVTRQENQLSPVILSNERNQVVQTTVNFDETFNVGLSLNYHRQLTPWWSTTTNFELFTYQLDSKVQGYDVNDRQTSFSATSNNSLSLPLDLTGEVTMMYNHRQLFGLTRLEPLFDLSLGIQKKVLNDKGSVRLNVSDLFYQYFVRGNTTFDRFNESFSSRRETRVVTLSFNYNFGKNTVPANRQRSGGATDEKRRIN